MGMTVPSFTAAVTAEVEKLPKVSGGGREADKIYVAQDVDKALNAAESAAKSMKDEYISVEHIFLGLLECANRHLKELFRTYNVTRKRSCRPWPPSGATSGSPATTRRRPMTP